MNDPDPVARLGHLIPEWQHREVHRRVLPADRQRVWDALWDLRVRDLTLTTALSRLRGGPSAWRNGVTPENADARVIDSMSPRVVIADEPEELVLVDVARYTAMRPTKPDAGPWTPDGFAAFDEPGWSKVAMDFRLRTVDGGTELTTETRVVSTDSATARRFAAYWLMIRAGSGLVRRDLLRAVAAAVQRPAGREDTMAGEDATDPAPAGRGHEDDGGEA